MLRNNYVLNVAAKRYIKSIAIYTIENFGVSQSLKYAEALKSELEKIAINPEFGRRYVLI
ncbi:MAG: type II toxin-antitoxin system RelE/ParE family toxin [Bacteroidota bacterium]